MAETVETAVYRLQVEGQPALAELKSYIDGLAIAQENATGKNRVFSQGLQSSIARYDETARALENIRKAYESYEKYAEAGVGTQQQLAAYYEITNAKVAAQTQKLNELAVATENARRKQAEVTAGPGITVQRAGGTEAYAAQFEAAAKAQEEQVASINKLRAAMNPLEEAQGRIATQMIGYRTALKEGKISQEEYAAASQMAVRQFGSAQTAVNGLADAHKGLAGQGQAAFHAVRSMVEMVAMGMSPMQALTSQMNHLAFAASGEGGIVGAFKQAGGMIGSMIETAKGFLTPINLVVGAVAAIGTAALYSASQFASAQKEIERSLLGIGGQSGATAAKINQFAHIGPQESITGLSPGERRDVGTAFAQTGNIDISKLKGVEDAVRGYAIVAGKDAKEATDALAKALGGNLVKAVDDLEKVYGALDPALRDTVRTMLAMNNVAGAQQAIIDAVADANKRALGTITLLEAGWKGLVNTLKMAAEGAGFILSYKVWETEAQKQARTAKELAASLAGVKQQQDLLIGKGIKVIEDQTPEIAQLDKLKQQLADLKAAKEAAAAAGKPLDDKGGIEQSLQNQIAVLEEIQARVADLREKWDGVSAAAARSLEAQQAQLPVIEAVGGAAKIQAQYAKDYYDILEKTKDPAEALLQASMNRATTEAAINAQAKETLWNLQNQLPVLEAITEEGKRAAEAEAMKNKLIHDGVDATLAKQVAQQKQTNDEAAARSSALKDTKAFVENVDLGGGATARLGQHIFHATEGASSLVKQTKQGVDALGQMDLSAGTLETSFVGAAMAAERVAAATDMAAENTARAAKTAADLAFVMKNGIFAPNVMPTGQLGFTADPNLSVAYRGGGIGKNLSINYDYTQLNQTNQALADKAAADTLATYDQAIAKATAERNPAGQLAAYQSELGYVQGLPASTENYQKIASLQNSIDSLTKSTDSNTSATQANSELLSPYYTQDPRTSHIGFRSQGMASGGYVDVPGGSSANDNMLATIPVASGERIYVDPMTGRRGTASGGNLTINISSPVMIAGNASKDDVGRTMFQNNQNLAKQLRSVTQ